MYEWQNKSELFLPSGFSIPFCKGVGGYVSYESSIKSNEPCVIDAAHARFLAKKRLPKLIFDFMMGLQGAKLARHAMNRHLMIFNSNHVFYARLTPET